MPTTIQISRFRKRRSERFQRSPLRKIGHGCGFAIALLIAAGHLFTSAAYAALVDDLPSVEDIPALFEPPDGLLLQPTRLYDRTGGHVIAELQNPLSKDRVYLHLDSLSGENLLPSTVISATLVASDPSFWQHPGFTLAGLFNASDRTLAQRLVAGSLLSNQPDGWRMELAERLLAFQLTSLFGREKVLEWYLNSADYGHMAFGVQAAAQLYLGKPAAGLTVAEAALLAGIPDSPQANPIDDPLAAMEKQKQVILGLLQNRLIDPEQGIQSVREQVPLRGPLSSQERFELDSPQNNIAPAFTRLALSQLEGRLDRKQLERGGLRVITTLDYDLLQGIQCALEVQLARMENAPPPAGITVENCPALSRLPALEPVQDPAESTPQLELEVLDAPSGQILLLSRTPESEVAHSPVNAHPAGTITTPFIYLSAFTQGFSPASLSWDIPEEGQASDFAALANQFHGPVRLRTALANDYLAPAASLAKQVGVPDILRISGEIGLLPASYIPATGSSILDMFGEVNLVQATQSYGVFANMGNSTGLPRSRGQVYQTGQLMDDDISSTAILRVENARGEILYDWSEPASRPILSPQLAYLITDVLSDEPARWPELGNPNYLEIDRPAAMKIGRTAAGLSSWVIGYTPQLVVGVWAGAAAGNPEGLTTLEPGAGYEQAATGLWSAVARFAHQDKSPENWHVPERLVFMEVCEPSGMLPDDECPAVVKEVFLEGNEPVQQDSLYQSLRVNQTTGMLATLFTPPDLWEQRVFMVVPPAARAWAEGAGLHLPPDAYDALPDIQPDWENAAIASPTMFQPVHGVVKITGTASTSDFAGYRLQVGQSLNPSSWLQIGNESNSQVVDGQLGLWDTTGLDGLYALQLLVLHQDKSVQRASVLVTVDNQAPTITVISPTKSDRLSSVDHSELLVQIQAEDNLGLESVSIYIDGKLLATFQSPPFAYLWKMIPGEHTIRAIAVDRAGNQADHTTSFMVE